MEDRRWKIEDGRKKLPASRFALCSLRSALCPLPFAFYLLPFTLYTMLYFKTKPFGHRHEIRRYTIDLHQCKPARLYLLFGPKILLLPDQHPQTIIDTNHDLALYTRQFNV